MTDDPASRRTRQPAASAWDGDGIASSGTGDAAPAPAADRPLPPLPDGGLAARMPDWLRGDPATGGRADGGGDGAGRRPADGVIDPTTFLTEDDLPDWLRRLAGGGEGGRVDAVGGSGVPAGVGGRAVPPAAFRERPATPGRRATDPVDARPSRSREADRAGGVAGVDGRNGVRPAAVSAGGAAALRPVPRRPIPKRGRVAPAGGARAVSLALAVLVVVLLVLLVATIR